MRCLRASRDLSRIAFSAARLTVRTCVSDRTPFKLRCPLRSKDSNCASVRNPKPFLSCCSCDCARFSSLSVPCVSCGPLCFSRPQPFPPFFLSVFCRTFSTPAKLLEAPPWRALRTREAPDTLLFLAPCCVPPHFGRLPVLRLPSSMQIASKMTPLSLHSVLFRPHTEQRVLKQTGR